MQDMKAFMLQECLSLNSEFKPQHLRTEYRHALTAGAVPTGPLGHAQMHSASTFRVLDDKLLSSSPACRTINWWVLFLLPLPLQIIDLSCLGNLCSLLSTFISHSSNKDRTRNRHSEVSKSTKKPKRHFVEHVSTDVLPNREAEDAKKSSENELYQCSYTVWHSDFILNRITSPLPVSSSGTILINTALKSESNPFISRPQTLLDASSLHSGVLHCNEVRKFKCQGTSRPHTLPCKNKAQNRKQCAFF